MYEIIGTVVDSQLWRETQFECYTTRPPRHVEDCYLFEVSFDSLDGPIYDSIKHPDSLFFGNLLITEVASGKSHTLYSAQIIEKSHEPDSRDEAVTITVKTHPLGPWELDAFLEIFG